MHGYILFRLSVSELPVSQYSSIYRTVKRSLTDNLINSFAIIPHNSCYTLIKKNVDSHFVYQEQHF